MIPVQIQHPLRTIAIAYNHEGPLKGFEDKLLKEYQRLHTELLEIQRYINERLVDLEDINNTVKKINGHYDKLQTETKKYGAFLGFADASLIKEEGEVIIEVEDLGRLVKAIETMIDEYNAAIASFSKCFDSIDLHVDAFELLFEEFEREYLAGLGKNSENMQIDYCSMDDDFEKFREELNKMYKLKDLLIDSWNLHARQNKSLETSLPSLYNNLETISKFLTNQTKYMGGEFKGFSEN